VISRPRGRRPTSRLGLRPRGRQWLAAIAAVGIVANGIRLRERLVALPTLPPEPNGPPDPDHAFLVADGVKLDAATRQAVSAYARANNLDVLDLVPGDLPTERLLELARAVDPGTYRTEPLAPGRGAYQATLVHAAVLERAGIEASETLDPVAYVRAMTTLKQHAPRTSDLVVVPRLRAGAEDVERRRAMLEALAGDAAPLLVGAPFVQHAVLAAGPVLSPFWGAVALAAHAAQPALVCAGTPVRPRDAAPAIAARRWPRGLRRHVRTARGRWTPPAEVRGPSVDDPELRATYDVLLAGGTDRFFEPRRADCPMCGSGDLAVRVVVPDLLQFKPGEFTLEECTACAHVFQNPRLTIDGLDFYYRDFYDGLGAQQTDALFALGQQSYQGRIEMVDRATTPKRWLDVGGGHGHFCLLAAEAFPQTRFDALDLSDSIDEAARRGWIEQAHRGLFPELAPDLVGSYDVVSMHHYLEHTREPVEELVAAHAVLEPGGHLLIEVPDPESRMARRLGPFWGPWFQPQHQHFLSVTNLSAALVANGFTVVDVERGPAHQPVDLSFALWILCNRIAPPPPAPWLPPPTFVQRAARMAVFVGAGPFLAATLLIDHLLAPLTRRARRGSNTYRLLARRKG
jgi:SAM-dependent methyltransferase